MSKERPPTSGSWVPGVSGNPGGRSKERREREKRLSTAVHGLGGEDAMTYLKVLHDIATNGGEESKDRIVAVKTLLDRGWGKSPDVVEIEGGGLSGAAAALLAATGMTPHERRKAEAELDAAPDDDSADDDDGPIDDGADEG